MTAADIVYEETEAMRIESWRSEELERAGYDRRAAAGSAPNPLGGLSPYREQNPTASFGRAS